MAWLRLRFALGHRGTEDLLAQRGFDLPCETARRWAPELGPAIAQRPRQRRARPTGHWRLDGMAVRIAGERMHLWRAVGSGCEALDVLVQGRRDRTAAPGLTRKPHGKRAPRPGRSRRTSSGFMARLR